MDVVLTTPLRGLKSGPIGSACAFVDRDGVINEWRDGYVTTWDDFAFRPGAIDALRRLSQKYPIVVVSNQRCVGRGLATVEEVRSVMDAMCEVLQARGVTVAAWYACPHEITDGCHCRKPHPGMFFAAAADLVVDVSRSFVIGDSDSDLAAGVAARCAAGFLCSRTDPSSLVGVVNSLVGNCDEF